jgi:hypothetical protein
MKIQNLPEALNHLWPIFQDETALPQHFSAAPLQ